MTYRFQELAEPQVAFAYCLQHQLLRSPLEQAAGRMFKLGVADEQILAVITGAAHRHIVGQSTGKFPPFRASLHSVEGLVVGADALTGERVCISPSDLSRHAAFTGVTGAGKSVLAAVLTLGLLMVPSVLGIWLTDCYKHEVRRCLPLFARVGRKAAVLTPSTTPFNPLQVPPGRDPIGHAAVTCGVLTRSLGLPERASVLLHSAVHRLYRSRGVLEGKQGTWPLLYDVFEAIRTDSSANAAAREALLDRLRELLLALTPAAAAWRRGWLPAQLAERSILWERDNTAQHAWAYLLDAMVSGVLTDQLHRPHTGPWPRTVVLIDDAQRQMSEFRQASGSMSPLAETVLVSRSAGTALVLGHQTTLGVDPLLLSQMGTRLVGRLGAACDYQWMAAEMGVSAEAVEWCKHHLTPGLFVLQTATGEDRYPHLVRVPNVELPQVSQREVDDSRACLGDLPLEQASEYDRWEPWPVAVVSQPVKPPPTRGDGEAPPVLSDAERRYLQAVVDQPGLPSSRYAKLAGVSPKAVAAIRRHLIELGLTREHTVAQSRTGRPAVVIEPLQAAHAALRESADVQAGRPTP